VKRLQARHYVFIGLALVTIVAMILPYRPEVVPSAETRRMYDYIDSLPEGSVLLISFDHEASSIPEIKPLALALLRHAYSKRIKLIGIALLAEGTGIGYGLMREAAREYGLNYGEDFVYLGFRPQHQAAILSIGESLSKTFPNDYLGREYDELSMLRTVEDFDDVAGVISIADGSRTTDWVELGHARYGVRVSAFVAAAMVTTYDPYVASGQIYAMVGGLRGAAEYEKLIGIGGSGARGMLAQTSMHLYIILMIVIGNVIYFTRKRRGRA
jgi:hypothetical protein